MLDPWAKSLLLQANAGDKQNEKMGTGTACYIQCGVVILSTDCVIPITWMILNFFYYTSVYLLLLTLFSQVLIYFTFSYVSH